MIHLSDSAKRVLAFIAVLVLVAMSGAAIYAILFQPAPPEAADAWGVRGGQIFPQEANFRGPVNVHNASDLTLYNASATPVVVIDGAAGDVDLAGTLTVPSLVTTTTDLTLTGDLAVGDDATITGDLLANTATITGAISAADLTASDDLVVGDDATITGTLTFGANNLYPLGFGTDGYQIVLGSSTVTTTAVITHGLTTPLYGFCTMSGSLTDDEEQKCSLGISGADVTVYVWKEDGTAGNSGVDVFWQVFGTP